MKVKKMNLSPKPSVWLYTVADPMCPEMFHTGSIFSNVSAAKEYVSVNLPGVEWEPAFDSNIHVGYDRNKRMAFIRRKEVQGATSFKQGDSVFIVLKRTDSALAQLIPNTDCVFATFKTACKFVRSMYPNARIEEVFPGWWECICRAGGKEESFYIYEEIVK